MKINYKTHPVLEKLQKGSLGVMPTLTVDTPFFDECLPEFLDVWNLGCAEFRKEINVISQPFHEATAKAEPKLQEVLKDIMNGNEHDLKFSGTFIQGDAVSMIDIDISKERDFIELKYFVFHRDGTPVMCWWTTPADGWNNPRTLQWLTSSYDRADTLEKMESFINGNMFATVITHMFKSFAQVETKILGPKEKSRDINCNYNNGTKMKLTFLDSKWFTNLVKSDGFLVRGHFRLQPKKVDGAWTKELIWIDPFEKSGYTAPARKTQLKYETNPVLSPQNDTRY